MLGNYCNIYLLGEEGSRIIHYSDLQEKVVLGNYCKIYLLGEEGSRIAV